MNKKMSDLDTLIKVIECLCIIGLVANVLMDMGIMMKAVTMAFGLVILLELKKKVFSF